MDCRERERNKAGAEIGRVSLKPHWVLFATLNFITSSNHGLQRKGERRHKKRLGENRSAFLGLIIF